MIAQPAPAPDDLVAGACAFSIDGVKLGVVIGPPAAAWARPFVAPTAAAAQLPARSEGSTATVAT